MGILSVPNFVWVQELVALASCEALKSTIPWIHNCMHILTRPIVRSMEPILFVPRVEGCRRKELGVHVSMQLQLVP